LGLSHLDKCSFAQQWIHNCQHIHDSKLMKPIFVLVTLLTLVVIFKQCNTSPSLECLNAFSTQPERTGQTIQ